MQYSLLICAVLSLGQTEPLGPGNHRRTVTVEEQKRSYLIHVPPKYDAKKPTPVVLALHGAGMHDKIMERFCGMDETADAHNFIVIYPNGTGPLGVILTWNAGLFPGKLNKHNADDVKYLNKVLDDLPSVLNVDTKRIYVAGLSNGGMMAYRVASEMSERVAAVASVAGTMVIEDYHPKRPIPVLHIHGTKDTIVPYNGGNKKENPKFLHFRSVDDTIMTCVKANGCAEKPMISEVEMKEDKTKVIRKEYDNCKNNADVVLYVVEDGGHTWPGMKGSPAFLGVCTGNISANEVIWDFFKKHPLK
jgi:polyhydroxybutyrate depolymerase